MKKFVKRISIFIILFIVMLYPLDIIVSHILKNTSGCFGEYEVWNDIYKGDINCDLAIYGSSRAWINIDPEIIRDSLGLPAYNFGVDGHDFWLQYFRHAEYFQTNTNPKIILHSVDVFTFRKRADLYNMNQFLPYMLWNKSIFNYTSSYQGFSRVDFIIPMFRYVKKASGFDIMTRNKLISKPLRNKGFHGMQLEWNSDLDAARKTNEYYEAKIDTASIKLYKKFLDECASKHIDVILVYTPEYIEGQKYVSNREEVLNIYKKIAKDYDLVFLDYSNNEMSYDKRYFYNSEHLNAFGADVFTRTLSHDIKVAQTIQ